MNTTRLTVEDDSIAQGMLEDKNLNLKQIIIRLSQGNPGAVSVLMEIAKTEPEFLIPLGLAMELTGSKGYGLWMVYKDRCKHNIEETKVVLREWFDNSCLPLEQWVEK